MISPIGRSSPNCNFNKTLMTVCLVLIVWCGYLQVKVAALEETSTNQKAIVDQITRQISPRLLPVK